MRLLVVLCLAALAAAAPTEPTNLRPVVSRANPRSPATADGPDILIQSGTVVATAADYEMDGTMWVALTTLDSQTYLYKSTDRGTVWLIECTMRGSGIMDKLGLVVGEGDSTFVYLFYLVPDNNGDLQVFRRDPVTHAGETFLVAMGQDTVQDFAVCRDYSGSNYWLYAVATNPDTIANARALRFLRSSTYGREWYVTDSFAVQVHDPSIAFGAGSWCYFSAVMPLWMGGSVLRWRNRSWCSTGNWTYDYFTSDSDAVADPVIAPAFTAPESLAAVWCVYSQNFNNSGDWDVKYT